MSQSHCKVNKGMLIEPYQSVYQTLYLNFILIHFFTIGRDGRNKKRTRKNPGPYWLVDNSIEISNISLTPKDLIDTHHIMTLIMKS